MLVRRLQFEFSGAITGHVALDYVPVAPHARYFDSGQMASRQGGL